ncbi:alpha/beta fold hydrolase [Nonomuraea salmonea]|uniref:alpha/beta fold hydrolase n=1 Tax=Nonomuraea salmonea TaxID=46181 RepID=UPI0031F0B0CA
MPELRRVPVNGVELNVAIAGSGPAVLLLHGFPHTWQVWTDVMADLSAHHQVIAPDLRGFGASSRAATGYDAATLADDAAALLTALGVSSAAVAGIDAGTPPAFLLAARRPDLVRRLVVMESLLGRLPGAEDFLAGGPPWWFGFHAVPGLAETVLEGNEAAYVDWFLNAGTLGEGVVTPRHPGRLRPRVHRQRGPGLRVLLLPGAAGERGADRAGGHRPADGADAGDRRETRRRRTGAAASPLRRRPHRPRHRGLRPHHPAAPAARPARAAAPVHRGVTARSLAAVRRAVRRPGTRSPISFGSVAMASPEPLLTTSP